MSVVRHQGFLLLRIKRELIEMIVVCSLLANKSLTRKVDRIIINGAMKTTWSFIV